METDTESSPPSGRRRIRRPGRGVILSIASVLAGTIVLGVLSMSGLRASSRDTLEVMGFDLDRAVLITSFLCGALGAAAAALVAGRSLPAMVIGLAGVAAAFGRTFVDETSRATASRGPQGDFDPLGWSLTLGTLVVAALVIGWAVAAIAIRIRLATLAVGHAAWNALRGHRLRDRAWLRVTGVVVTLAVVTVASSTLGDMLNYTPDAHMRVGGQPLVGLTSGGGPTLPAGEPTPAPNAGDVQPSFGAPSATPSPIQGASRLVAGPIAHSLLTAGSWSRSRPWRGHAPSGQGRLDTLTFPSPWIGAGGATVPVQVYVPPGYNATTARYPTLYVVPWSYDAWARSVQVAAQLDALITSGSIPPQVVVFVPEAIGPYPVSGCADSANGRVWWDRYLTQTVVPRIDASYRTMTGAASRSVMGMSEGGYCAADILSRHPDMFGNAIAISGYYDAVPAAGHVGPVQTMFGTDPSRYAAWSPTSLVRSLRPAVRASVYFILIGRPAQAFYGQYFSDFGDELASSGTPCALLSDGIGHSWSEARAMLAPALEILAGHMAARGVFGG